MLPTRIPELSRPFPKLPHNLPQEGQKAILEIKGENQLTVKAEVNHKNLPKIVGQINTWDNWVASPSGTNKTRSPVGLVRHSESGSGEVEYRP